MRTTIDIAVSYVEDEATANAMRSLYAITEHGNSDADNLIIAATHKNGIVPKASAHVLRQVNPDLVNEDGTIPYLRRQAIREALDMHYLAIGGLSRHYVPDLLSLDFG